MKKCYACYAMNDDKAAVCSKCKFVFPRIVGNPAKIEPIIRQAAEEYRKNHMIGVKIGMTVYSYELINDELQETGKNDVILVEDISKEIPGNIVWGEDEYAGIDAGEEITLSVFTVISDTRKVYELTVTAPETEGLWKVGVCVEEGFAFRIVIGTPSSYTETKTVSLFS